jgi:hypothetical protein
MEIWLNIWMQLNYSSPLLTTIYIEGFADQPFFKLRMRDAIPTPQDAVHARAWDTAPQPYS